MRQLRRSVEHETARIKPSQLVLILQRTMHMPEQKPAPRPVMHDCPVCHFPQTKIQRKLAGEKHGATNYVCARTECVLGINLTKVDTWVAV